jgi:hypothetical protein
VEPLAIQRYTAGCAVAQKGILDSTFVIGKIGQLLGFGLTMEGVRLYGQRGPLHTVFQLALRGGARPAQPT